MRRSLIGRSGSPSKLEIMKSLPGEKHGAQLVVAMVPDAARIDARIAQGMKARTQIRLSFQERPCAHPACRLGVCRMRERNASNARFTSPSIP